MIDSMGSSLDFYTFYISKDLSFPKHGNKTTYCTFLDVKVRDNEVCMAMAVYQDSWGAM